MLIGVEVKGQLRELILSFHYVGPRAGVRESGLVVSAPAC